jgi:hypothetical protein
VGSIDSNPWHVLVGWVELLGLDSVFVVVLDSLGAGGAGVDIVPVEAELRGAAWSSE